MRFIASLASIPLEELLLAGRAAFLVFCFVLAAFAFTRWRRAAEREAAHIDERLKGVLERLERLETIAVGIEPSIAALGEQLETRLKTTTSAASANNYPIAIRLARAGARPEELVSSCGLTRQEAELVTRLHGRTEAFESAHVRRDHPAAA